MATTTLSLEERVTALETEMERLRRDRSAAPTSPDEMPWWERIIGTFANDPMYDEAMRLGREYRDSQRPVYDDDVPA